MRRQLIMAAVGAVLFVAFIAAPAAASFLIELALTPDHGSPGTLVHVTGFPPAELCPSVRMYIAPVSGITSFADHRLSRLTGTVTYGLVGNGSSTGGSLVRGAEFWFRVPALTPGTYITYFSCVGAKDGWTGLIPGTPYSGSTLRVDPLPPGATVPPTTMGPIATTPTDSTIAWLLVGMPIFAGTWATTRRRFPRRGA